MWGGGSHRRRIGEQRAQVKGIVLVQENMGIIKNPSEGQGVGRIQLPVGDWKIVKCKSEWVQFEEVDQFLESLATPRIWGPCVVGV